MTFKRKRKSEQGNRSKHQKHFMGSMWGGLVICFSHEIKDLRQNVLSGANGSETTQFPTSRARSAQLVLSLC